MDSNKLLPLASNLSTQNRDYVTFVGAGFSKDAGLMSGWDILIDTLKDIYILENSEDEKFDPNDKGKIEEWYISHSQLKDMGYSEILEYAQQGEVQRREHLKKYFLDKKPGESHKKLAQMVANNLIRFIFTTNFDDLIEKALDELSLDYDVIFSDDILEKTVSWDKVKTCRIYKLHGDYKTGMVRNTISELDTLDRLVGEDFQYIIDRHGLIVVGYSGRDKAIMEHFINRKPYAYPFYWQYVNELPPENEEFSLFNDLRKRHLDLDYEIKFIEDQSASNFLGSILGCMEKLNRYSVISDKDEDFHDYITSSNEKQIRKLSLDLYKEFSEKYFDFCEREGKDKQFIFRYQVFEEFINDTGNIINYIFALNEFDLTDESNLFVDKIINLIVGKDFSMAENYIKRSYPYYFIMCCSAIYLRFKKPDFINSFFKLKIKNNSYDFVDLMYEISYQKDGWDSINRNKYKLGTNYPKFDIIFNNFLPSKIDEIDFLYGDTYIFLKSLIEKDDCDYWCEGASSHIDAMIDIFELYFSKKIKSKSDIEDLIEKLRIIKKNKFIRFNFFGIFIKYLQELPEYADPAEEVMSFK